MACPRAIVLGGDGAGGRSPSRGRPPPPGRRASAPDAGRTAPASAGRAPRTPPRPPRDSPRRAPRRSARARSPSVTPLYPGTGPEAHSHTEPDACLAGTTGGEEDAAMFPIFEPVMLMFQPIVTGLLALAAGAVGGIVAVVWLVAFDPPRGHRPPRALAEAHLPEAARPGLRASPSTARSGSPARRRPR